MEHDSDIILGERGARQARFGAALFDIIVVAWALGGIAAVLRGVVPGDASLLLLWTVLVLTEGTLGRSPGKIVAGLSVTREDDPDARPGLLRAALRRPWGVPVALMPFGDTLAVIGTYGAILVLVAMLVSIGRSEDGRGLHDRLSGTQVVGGPFDRRARLVVVSVVVVLVLVSLVLMAASPGTEIAAAASTR